MIPEQYIRPNSLYWWLQESYKKIASKTRRSERIRKYCKDPQARQDSQKEYMKILSETRRSERLRKDCKEPWARQDAKKNSTNIGSETRNPERLREYCEWDEMRRKTLQIFRARWDAQKDYERILKILKKDETLRNMIPKTHEEFVRIEKRLKRYRMILTISRDLHENKTRQMIWKMRKTRYSNPEEE